MPALTACSPPLQLDPGAVTFGLTSAGGFDIFVSKLDSAGDFVYARRLGGTSNEQSLNYLFTDDYLTRPFSTVN